MRSAPSSDREVAFVDQVQDPTRRTRRRLRTSRALDGAFAYQLAVVVDDAAQGVTSVVRGVDLLCSTPQQLYLQELLGLPHPAYAHIPLLVAERDRRLSKRDRDAALDALLARFKTPEAVIGHIAGITGLLCMRPRNARRAAGDGRFAALPTTFDDLASALEVSLPSACRMTAAVGA
ncbi:MAG: glutamate--tRNA ligase family protein [Eggerthellaceae bacterium]